MPVAPIGWPPAAGSPALIPRAAIRRRDAGAAHAAIVEVGPAGELRVEPLHAGSAEVAPARVSPTGSGEVGRRLRIGAGTAA